MEAVSRLTIPCTNYSIELSTCNKKVIAVALASILFLGYQMSFSAPIVFFSTALIASTTYFCEKDPPSDWRDQRIDWFNTDSRFGQLAKIGIAGNVLTILLILIAIANGHRFPIYQVTFAKQLFAKPLNIVFLVTVIAPFSEEILFRGFLHERFQDLFHFLNRRCPLLSREAVEKIANLAQALIFSAAHFRAEVQQKLLVFAALTSFGYSHTLLKEESKSLYSPLLQHSLSNARAIFLLYIGRNITKVP